MTRFTPDAELDLMLLSMAEADRLFLCSAPPADFAGIAAVALVEYVLTPEVGEGDFTLGNSATSGRRLTLAAQEGGTIDASGEADHWAIADEVEEVLKHVGELDEPQVLTEGGTADTSAVGIEVADPTAPA